LVAYVTAKIVQKGYVKDGDIIVITGSTQLSAGATNMLQVQIVGDILLKGKGEGTDNVSGRVCVIKNEEKDLVNFIPGDILAVSITTTNILQLMRQCSGIITEESASGSGVTAAALALEVPVISGAKNATQVLKTGAKIRLDTTNGYVYNSDADYGL
jgi:pyruvate kinase